MLRSEPNVSLIESGADVLINPVNLQGVPGAGLAKVFADLYPESTDIYRGSCASKELRPGRLLAVDQGSHMVVFFPTKTDWRQRSSTTLIKQSLDALAYQGSRHVGGLWGKIGMPKIGCGLGGLHWEKQVQPLVRDILAGFQVTVYDGHIDTSRVDNLPENVVGYKILDTTRVFNEIKGLLS